ncbi:MAG: ribonuclease HII [Armatimonadota bacterium]|nr:ribonuclease HII [Armatimonadota bacterium]MDR7578717.1 ribonuclease HII [Armatimonadota bacterium]MDR7580403.1 ribonuclease HII [Armatimonadota bacterium]MDR7594107.1 ribonuclease HII [Armatimonadota bacterium]MDR7599665.1 ribonuclease HII [Armatimonadota bacterium]
MERGLRRAGYRYVAGVDEAGRGPLAGPVVAAAVVLDARSRIPGLQDSKRLSPHQREEVAEAIRRRAVSWAVAQATVEEVDRLNVLHASRLAMRRAVEQLSVRPSVVLVDGGWGLVTDLPQRVVVGGDGTVACIAAASVLAKVERDRIMVELDRAYPGYGFAQHKGYACPAHLEALRRLGPSPVHRRSFAPVRTLGLDLWPDSQNP